MISAILDMTDFQSEQLNYDSSEKGDSKHRSTLTIPLLYCVVFPLLLSHKFICKHCKLQWMCLYFLDDIIGKILAWSSLAPIFIIVSFITLILFRRELHTVSSIKY